MASRFSKLSLSKKMKPHSLLSRFSSRVDAKKEEETIELTEFPTLSGCEFDEGTHLLCKSPPKVSDRREDVTGTFCDEGVYEVMSLDLPPPPPLYENMSGGAKSVDQEFLSAGDVMHALIAHEMPEMDDSPYLVPIPVIKSEQEEDVRAVGGAKTIKKSLIHPVRAKTVYNRSSNVHKSEAVTREIGRYHLGNERYVVVCMFKGDLKVHIRQYSDTGFPTMKGICLTPSRWATLMTRFENLESVFKGVAQGRSNMISTPEHLGGNVFATASDTYMTVDIRQHFFPNKDFSLEARPTRKGITLRQYEWRNLLRLSHDINNSCIELARAEPCMFHSSHRDIMGFFRCQECNPSGRMSV